MLGQKIKCCRQQKGFTQQIVADAIGVDVTTISKIENSKANPSLQVLKAIAKALGVDIAELLDTA